ncbi:MAG: VWA domain-containing protein [Myxococcales bacterium]|nr:VWA domain-containing protein [Myxococcales bacterium]
MIGRLLIGLGVVVVCAGCGRTGLFAGEPLAGMDGGRVFDAGLRDASTPEAGGPDAGHDAGPLCSRSVELTAEEVEPSTVILLVDASSSMRVRFGGGLTRWEAVRAAFVGPDGVIGRIEDRVPVGLVRYTAVIVCPTLDTLPAQLGASAAIDDVLAELPGGSTPTADTLMRVRADIERLRNGFEGPLALVLATDGEPTVCDGPTRAPEFERARVVEQVELAFGEGVRTFVLGVGREIADAHLQAIANAGAGVGAGEPDAIAWRADDPATLSDQIARAVGAAASCVATLPWSVPVPCDAAVELGGEPLACNDPDGYRIVGAQIELRGAACDAFAAGASMTVRPGC